MKSTQIFINKVKIIKFQLIVLYNFSKLEILYYKNKKKALILGEASSGKLRVLRRFFRIQN